MIVELGTAPLLYLIVGLAALEATMALRRAQNDQANLTLAADKSV